MRFTLFETYLTYQVSEDVSFLLSRSFEFLLFYSLIRHSEFIRLSYLCKSARAHDRKHVA